MLPVTAIFKVTQVSEAISLPTFNITSLQLGQSIHMMGVPYWLTIKLNHVLRGNLINFRILCYLFLAWRRYQLWIGGRSVGGAGLNPFKWYGRLTDGNGEGTQILFGDWEQVQPSYNGECIAVMDDRRSDVAEPLRENYKWNDAPCSAPKFYVCEKPESSS